jgi:hypothetical protein
VVGGVLVLSLRRGVIGGVRRPLGWSVAWVRSELKRSGVCTDICIVFSGTTQTESARLQTDVAIMVGAKLYSNISPSLLTVHRRYPETIMMLYILYRYEYRTPTMPHVTLVVVTRVRCIRSGVDTQLPFCWGLGSRPN